MKTNEKLASVRQMMADHHIAALVVPSTDPHQSEYVTAYWQTRAWLTGFTGSAGVAVVTQTRACLWTDFRYWIQAASQIQGSEFQLFKSGEPGVPEFHDWIIDHLSARDIVAMDGRVVSMNQEKKYRKPWAGKQIQLQMDLDPVGRIWEDRPSLPGSRAWIFPEKFAGQSRGDKIAQIRDAMTRAGADYHVMTGLEDIAWTLNLRGADAPGNPVNLAFVLLGFDQVALFIDPGKMDTDTTAALSADGIHQLPYDAIDRVLRALPDQTGVLVDPDMVSSALSAAVNPACRVIESVSPAARFKAVKNEIQIRHVRDTAVKDGVAVVRFLYWLANRKSNASVSEIRAARKLFEFRCMQADFVENSFSPIMAYGDHSAMCHYSANEETDVCIKDSSLFLTDTGGNYLTGTTDITRTVCLGRPSADQIRDYTLVLKGHIAVATACFPEGTRGFQIDTLARQFLWQNGMNFGHGTGHGVGFFLCVHEGPARISPHPVDVALEKGMLMTNEPGLYREGEYGIRLENMVLVTEARQTRFGHFLAFENMTWCHFERELMDVSLLTAAEIVWIDQYHQQVYDRISPHLETGEAAWLREKTRPL